MIDFSVYTVPVIKAELKKRGLPDSGVKSDLVIRLEEAIEIESFPKFNKLPPELRIMIWEQSLPSRRIVHVALSHDGVSPYGYLIYRCDLTAVRNIMLANKEASSVVLLRYGEAKSVTPARLLDCKDDVLRVWEDRWSMRLGGGLSYNTSSKPLASIGHSSIRTIAVSLGQFITKCINLNVPTMKTVVDNSQGFLASSLGSLTIYIDLVRLRFLPCQGLKEIILLGNIQESGSVTDQWGMEVSGQGRSPHSPKHVNWLTDWTKSAPNDSIDRFVLLFRSAVADASNMTFLKEVKIYYAGF
jgi:hypothetical protein